MARPVLDGFELPLVQTLEGVQTEAVRWHAVPGLEGDFAQDLGRRATRFHLAGVAVGDTAAAALKTLRDKHRAAAPLSFVDDIATATRVSTVLIEEMEAHEIAGRPLRTEYKLALVEFIPAPPPQNDPVPPLPPPLPQVAALEVTVIDDDDSAFDFSRVVVQVKGQQADGTQLSIVLTNRAVNVWTVNPMPAGRYVALASVPATSLSDSRPAVVIVPQTTRVTLHLHQGPPVARGFAVHYWFDKALIEPCLRGVMRAVASYAAAHPDEKMLIVGYTDLVGSTPYNQALSERRARGVFAYLTAGADPGSADRKAAVAEWDRLRRRGSATTRLEDNWAVREIQQILSGLGFYAGAIDEQNGPLTDAAIRNFQSDNALPVTGVVDDATWLALIDAYLGADGIRIPDTQFFPNCSGEIVKWLGSDEQDPVRNTEDAWRPNRRTEVVFIRADALPGKVAQPVTFDQPAHGAVNAGWCVGGDREGVRILSNQPGVPNTFLVQPVDPDSFTLRGQMKMEGGGGGTGVRYVLTAPDGEYLNGTPPRGGFATAEVPAGDNRGRPIPGTTDDDGRFDQLKPTPNGIYILSVPGTFTVRLASAAANSGTTPILCARLDKTQPFDVVLAPADGFDPRRKLTASVFGRDFTKLAATAVALTFPDGSTAGASTNAQGRFSVVMGDAFKTATFRYATSADPADIVQLDYFIDVGDIATDDGVSRRLHNLGFAPEADLPAAVRQFQATQGINPTGQMDDVTKARLNAVYAGDTAPFPDVPDVPEPVAPNPLSTDP
jgi:hypothetical protein